MVSLDILWWIVLARSTNHAGRVIISIFMIAMIGYLVFGLINLGLMIFNVPIAGGATSDKAVRAKAYSAAIKIATEQAYWLPINTYVNAYAFAKDLDFKTYPDELPRFYFAKWK